MIYPRLELLRDLLAEDGSIWVSIDDNEGHYLKVVMDEVFGRGNFVTTVIWQKAIRPETNQRRHSSHDHDYILLYAKERCNRLQAARILMPAQTNKHRSTRIQTMTHEDRGAQSIF